MDANTTAPLIRAALDIFFTKSPVFGGKYLITMVKIGQNLITTAPKSPGRKLQRRRSVCVDTVSRLEQ